MPRFNTLLASLLLAGAAAGQRVVLVAEVERGPLETKTLLQAEVRPREMTTIVARVTGVVQSMNVEAGDIVDPERLICDIHCPDLDASLAVAESRLAASRASVVVARSELEFARAGAAAAEAALAQALGTLHATEVSRGLAAARAERIRALHTDGAATAEELERAEAGLAEWSARIEADRGAIGSAEAGVTRCQAEIASRDAAIAVAEANVAREEAERNRAAILADFAQVRSPYPTARVTERSVDAGAHVIADRTELVQIEDARRVRVRFFVPESDAVELRPGMPARIIRHGLADITAAVTRASGAIDRTSRTMSAEIELDNTDGRWTTGALCQVELTTSSEPDALTVPSAALVNDGPDEFVFVVDSGRAKRVQVTTGADLGRRVQIKSGLSGGERVVVSGGSGLRDGEQVRVKEIER